MQSGLSELSLSFESVTVSVPASVLWWGAGIAVGISALISIVLVYHWYSYGYRATLTGIMSIAYFAGLLVLIGVMLFSIIAYLASV